MQRRIIECAANFSEGRDTAVVGALTEAIAKRAGVAVLHQTSDPDHNRSVITFAGSPEAVAEAAIRAVAKSIDLIDLNRHTGVHPRIGAADVIPFIPLSGITLEECANLAKHAAEEIWRSLRLPVYLYEAAAQKPDRVRLEQIRRGGFEKLREEIRFDTERHPDFGRAELHPTAGAAVVGARKVLIAYNINLDTDDIRVAKTIAKAIRFSSGGLPHVKALGLMLHSRRQVQVSINLTDYEVTPLHVVHQAVVAKARELGAAVAGSEIIGLIPGAALEKAAQSYLCCENYQPNLVIERRLLQMEMAPPADADGANFK